MASRYLQFPVTKTGCYLNQKEGKLEYWFVFGDQRSKIGECRENVPPTMRDRWEAEIAANLNRLILRNVADGTLRLDSAPEGLLKT